MNDAKLAELLLALRRRGGVPVDGPSLQTTLAWITDAARRGAAVQAQLETILHGTDWFVGTAALDYALAASEVDRTLLPIPMNDPNLVAHLNYSRRRLSVEHLTARPGAVLQAIVAFPPPPPAPQERLRGALHAALGRAEAHQRIPALLAVLPLTEDITVQLSIVDAAWRETNRLDEDKRTQWLPHIAQAEYRVLHQSGKWVRYGLLTETQQQGGVAYFAAESWLKTIGTQERRTVTITGFLVGDDHAWSLEALGDSLEEIQDVDKFSRECWEHWLEHSLPSALQAHREVLLGRLQGGCAGV